MSYAMYPEQPAQKFDQQPALPHIQTQLNVEPSQAIMKQHLFAEPSTPPISQQIRNALPTHTAPTNHQRNGRTPRYENENDDMDDFDMEDEDEDDVNNTFQNLGEQDASEILSPTISRKFSKLESMPRPPPPPSATRPDLPDRRPSPPKKGSFFGTSNKSSLSSLGHNFFTKPRSSSLGTKPDGTNEKDGLFSSFNLPNFHFPQMPTLQSLTDSAMSSYGTQTKTVTRNLRASSMVNTNRSIMSSRDQSPVGSTGQPPSRSSTTPTQTPASPAQARSPLSPQTRSLHRSNSDSSLRRSISRTSSIGSDTHFADVQKQVNSRFKAIKDSVLPDLIESFSFNNAVPLSGRLSLTTAPAAPVPEHPLEALRNVDIVILGGYRGSILHKVKPVYPGAEELRRGRRVWVPIKVGLKLRKVNLEVPLDPQAELDMERHVIPTGMLSNIGPVDISKRLLKRLRQNSNVRVHEFSYDWRLSPKLNSDKLLAYMENLPSNRHLMKFVEKADNYEPMVIAHSLGGLITRHAVNRRPELFRGGVCYAGVPQRCINILGPLKHGDAVLLNHNVLTAQVNFSFRSSFVFLPEDGKCFVDKRTGEDIPIDMYDANVWQELNLSPCVSQTGGPTATGLLTTATNAMAAVLQEAKEKMQHFTPPSSPAPGAAFFQSRSLTPPEEQSRTRSASDSATQRNNSGAVNHLEQMAYDAQDFEASGGGTMGPNMHSSGIMGENPNTQTCTIPLSETMPYLAQTLANIKQFRSETVYKPEYAKDYPPFTVLYSKTTPTVKGVRVDGRDGIKGRDCYDDLLFGAGDGVCLAREAMLPEGYRCEKRVAIDRGHVALLGDLDAVAQCIQSLVDARERMKRRRRTEA